MEILEWLLSTIFCHFRAAVGLKCPFLNKYLHKLFVDLIVLYFHLNKQKYMFFQVNSFFNTFNFRVEISSVKFIVFYFYLNKLTDVFFFQVKCFLKNSTFLFRVDMSSVTRLELPVIDKDGDLVRCSESKFISAGKLTAVSKVFVTEKVRDVVF